MFSAWRDMFFARTRFLLMGLVLALMSILVVIISDLTAGLVNDGVIVFQDGTQTDSAFTRSVVDLSAAADFAAVEDVEDATPTAHDIIVSSTLEDAGISLGDTITVDRLETELTVSGFTEDQRTFGHVALAYLPLDVWQEINAGARAGEAVSASVYDEVSVVVAQTTNGADLEALSAESGLEESFASSPGYTAETMTLSMIEWFLYIITALVTGAFFLVWTIQRSGDIAVMRAMGATKGYLLRDSLGQAVIILALSIATGVVLAVGLGLWLESTAMPYSTEVGPILGGAALLFAAGLLGALIAVFRVTRTDPLTALGENR